MSLALCALPLHLGLNSRCIHTPNTSKPWQGAAHSDAVGNVALGVAARVGAAEEVKQVLFEAHRGAVSEKGLWDVMVSGEGAVRSVLEARPEVSIAGCMCFAVGGWCGVVGSVAMWHVEQ